MITFPKFLVSHDFHLKSLSDNREQGFFFSLKIHVAINRIKANVQRLFCWFYNKSYNVITKYKALIPHQLQLTIGRYPHRTHYPYYSHCCLNRQVRILIKEKRKPNQSLDIFLMLRNQAWDQKQQVWCFIPLPLSNYLLTTAKPRTPWNSGTTSGTLSDLDSNATSNSEVARPR